MEKKRIRVGHSPDPDDAFMFYALTFGRLDTGPYEFVHQLEDIETLNRRALEGELEVSAVSIHAYAKLTDRYALLPTGSSMGDQYGPMIVARENFSREELPHRHLAVPGTLTTAFLSASLYSPGPLRYTVVPFDEILHRVEAGEFDAGLIIHEGQLTFAQQGLSLHVDLGVWWQEETGLPLPLGGNVIRKDLGPKAMSEISRMIRQSIRYALEHRDEALDYALKYARDMERDLAGRFVDMYVNHWTLDYGQRGRDAIRMLLDRGVQANIIPGPIQIEFVEDDQS
ncbi:ABC transporter substrate-binding protein [bacterium]|nr:ABC transporter substrate-binding protein [bacterium]